MWVQKLSKQRLSALAELWQLCPLQDVLRKYQKWNSHEPRTFGGPDCLHGGQDQWPGIRHAVSAFCQQANRLGSGTNHSLLKTMAKTKISFQAWKKQRGRTAKTMDLKSEGWRCSLVIGSGYLMPLTSGNQLKSKKFEDIKSKKCELLVDSFCVGGQQLVLCYESNTNNSTCVVPNNLQLTCTPIIFESDPSSNNTIRNFVFTLSYLRYDLAMAQKINNT